MVSNGLIASKHHLVFLHAVFLIKLPVCVVQLNLVQWCYLPNPTTISILFCVAADVISTRRGYSKSSKQTSYHMAWTWYEVANKIGQLNLPTLNPLTALYSSCINSYHCCCHYIYILPLFCVILLPMYPMLPLYVNVVVTVCKYCYCYVWNCCHCYCYSLYANASATIFKYCCMSLCKCCHHCNLNVTTIICITAAIYTCNCHCCCM